MKTVSYVSTRREVWRYYWRAWARPAGLWVVHVLIGLMVALVRTPSGTLPLSDSFVGTWLAATLVCMVVFPLYPLVRFKPQRRILTVDETGWTTEIGKVRGSRTWAQVRSIEDDGDAITIVGTSRNALIVPCRAFSDDTERLDFLESARHWHRVAPTR